MEEFAKSQKGSTIVLALIAMIVLGGASAALLSISVYRSKETEMGYETNTSLYIAEAGISDSMAEITADYDYGGDGLGNVSGSFGGGNYSVSAVDEGNNIWTLTSTGAFPGRHGNYRRGIEVVVGRQLRSPFKQAAFGGSSLSVGGSSICDSYDSDDGTYASQAVNTDPDTGTTYANDNGGVGSNGDITATGGEVYGDATPGPDGSVTGGGTYITGSTAPAAEERTFDPYTYTPVGSSLGQLNSSTTLTSGVHRYSDIKLTTDTVTLGQNAGDEITLYIDSTIGISGQAQIVVYPGAKVVMHHDAGAVSFTGGGLVNTSQIPSNFMFYSATTSAVKFAGTSDFYGAAYASDAPVNLTGTTAFYGSAVGNTVTVVGTSDIHYDEALARLDWQLGRPKYEAKTWREFKP